MLKHARNQVGKMVNFPAAFGRLCVETILIKPKRPKQQKPAAFGRLCVETTHWGKFERGEIASRLRAAVC